MNCDASGLIILQAVVLNFNQIRRGLMDSFPLAMDHSEKGCWLLFRKTRTIKKNPALSTLKPVRYSFQHVSSLNELKEKGGGALAVFERKRLLRNCVLFDSNSVVFFHSLAWESLNIQVLGSQLILWKALIIIRFDS